MAKGKSAEEEGGSRESTVKARGTAATYGTLLFIFAICHLPFAFCLFFLPPAQAQAPAGAQPANPAAVFAQAQRALGAGDYAAAERGFRRVLELDPRSAAAYVNLGVTYLRSGKVDLAIKSFEAARKLAPQMSGIDLNLARAFSRPIHRASRRTTSKACATS